MAKYATYKQRKPLKATAWRQSRHPQSTTRYSVMKLL